MGQLSAAKHPLKFPILQKLRNRSNITTMANQDDKIREMIPAEFHMISGSHDSQTSADAYNVGKFQLPNPAGKAGGKSRRFTFFNVGRMPFDDLAFVLPFIFIILVVERT